VPWAKLDDQFSDHPKVVAAGPLAGWLAVCGLCYASRYLTDGYIPLAQVRKLADLDNAAELTDRLVAAGLWEAIEGGYMIHDYLEYNPSRAQVLAAREANARRQEQWRQSQRQDDHTEIHSNAVTVGVTNTRPVPVPRTPYPEPELTTTPKEIGVVGRRKRREPTQPRPPAVEVYRETMHRYPDKAQFAIIGDTIGVDEAALRLWRSITEQWRDHGYNRQNLSGLLECFEKGGLEPRRGNTREPIPIERTIADFPKGWLQEGNDEDGDAVSHQTPG